MADNLWHEHNGERHEIVCIEYRVRRPFAVITLHHWDHTRFSWFKPGRDKPTGTSMEHWDFDWCKRDRESYYHSSGGGGEQHVLLHRFSRPSPPPGEIWVADGMPLVRYARRRGEWVEVPIKNDAELLRMGYRRLKQPRLLTARYGKKTRNPFEAGEEGETIYCEICDDHLCYDWNCPCDHLDWCEECGAWVYLDSGKLQDSYGPGECEHYEALVFDD